MIQNLLKKQILIIMFSLMFVAVASNNFRAPYSDAFCNTFNSDGSKCLKCSFHYFKDSKGTCQPVSDWCKTWDFKTGLCLSCFPGYGNPVKGVCASAQKDQGNLVGESNVNNCAEYGYLDAKNAWSLVWSDGCRKLCVQCEDGYFLTESYKCIILPQNCAQFNDDGVCTACQDDYILNSHGKCYSVHLQDRNDKYDDKKGSRKRKQNSKVPNEYENESQSYQWDIEDKKWRRKVTMSHKKDQEENQENAKDQKKKCCQGQKGTQKQQSKHKCSKDHNGKKCCHSRVKSKLQQSNQEQNDVGQRMHYEKSDSKKSYYAKKVQQPLQGDFKDIQTDDGV